MASCPGYTLSSLKIEKPDIYNKLLNTPGSHLSSRDFQTKSKSSHGTIQYNYESIEEAKVDREIANQNQILLSDGDPEEAREYRPPRRMKTPHSKKEKHLSTINRYCEK